MSCFTAALHLIRILYDIKGGQSWLNTDCLEYADDVALRLLDNIIVEYATERITQFEEGALKYADMVISRPKTEVMYVCRQKAPVAVTNEEVGNLIDEGILKHSANSAMQVSLLNLVSKSMLVDDNQLN